MSKLPLAIVTGAASGIGLALTQTLLARDLQVIAIDRDPSPLATHPRLTAVTLDVCDTAGMNALATAYAGREAAYVFSNAGVAAPGGVFNAGDAAWQRTWDINVMAHLQVLRAWWPQLATARGNAVVTVSAAALLTYPGAALYRAAKAALLSMLESLYYETAGMGVKLHALCPGMVQSNILVNARREKPDAPIDPITQYLMEAMRSAEPAADFAARILRGLEESATDPSAAPFYWLTHRNTNEALDAKLSAIKGGFPQTEFGAMP